MPELIIFSGRAGAGKTRAVLQRIKEHMGRGEQAFLLVPEQSTYEAERALAELCGGIIGAEVYGFSRLCERILQAAGDSKPYLSRQGRVMVAKRAIEKHADKLRLFARAARSPGFAKRMDELCGTMKKSGISPEALGAAVEQLEPQSQLSQKLSDIQLIYAACEDFLTPRYLTEDDMPNAVLDLLPTSFLAGAYVYVDGLDNPSQQMFRLLGAICACAARLTFTLRMDESEPALFASDRRIYDRLQELVFQRGIPFAHKALRAQQPQPTPALAHLEQYLFAHAAPVFSGDASAVSITAASNPYEEAEQLAERVATLARSGVRYRDMAVIAGDLERYAPLVSRAFALRGIPLFYDASRSIHSHAAAELMLASVAAVVNGYRAEELLRIAKTGYSGCVREDIEIFENYVLRYGVNGSEMKAPFRFGEVAEEAERVRGQLMEPLAALHEGLRRPTIAEKAEAVYDYLLRLGLAEQLQVQAQALTAVGEQAAAEVCAQVWAALCTLLSQLHTIMGDVPCAMRAFAAVLEEGVADNQAGVLPGTTDQVLLGDIRRTRIGKLHTLFAAGCYEGVLPRAHSDDGLLNDRELALMQGSGLTVWDGSVLLAQSDRLALYTALSKAQYGLHFSYSFADGDETLAPSPLLARVKQLLPDCAEQSALGESKDWPSCERTAFHTLAIALEKQRRGEEASPLLPALMDYFAEHPSYKNRLAQIRDGAALKLSPPPFGETMAAQMYGFMRHVSPSRLESFARCPYAHFARYALGASERHEAKEREADDGAFLHDAMDGFVRQAALAQKDLHSITHDEVEELLRIVVEPLLAAHKGGLLLRDPRLRESLFLRMEALSQSVYSLLAQLRAGSFSPLATEQTFGTGDGLPPLVLNLANGRRLELYGKIDRVDVARVGGQRLLRVVDYKRSGRKFEPSDVASGTALQLPLYLAAASDGGAQAGMYYMALLPDFAGESEFLDDAAQAIPIHPLVGITGADEAVIAASDHVFTKNSEIIAGLKRNKDGEATGPLATAGELADVLHSAKRTATRLAEEILSGAAAVSPLESACKFCAYGSICRFDSHLPACRTRKRRTVSLAELMAGDLQLPAESAGDAMRHAEMEDDHAVDN